MSNCSARIGYVPVGTVTKVSWRYTPFSDVRLRYDLNTRIQRYIQRLMHFGALSPFSLSDTLDGPLLTDYTKKLSFPGLCFWSIYI